MFELRQLTNDRQQDLLGEIVGIGGFETVVVEPALNQRQVQIGKPLPGAVVRALRKRSSKLTGVSFMQGMLVGPHPLDNIIALKSKERQ